MSIYETKNVTLSLERLLIQKASDRYWSDAEPYVVPVFYKVDGERYEAVLSILNSRDSDDMIEFRVDTLHPDSTPENFVPNNLNEDFPYTFIPPGKLLGRGSHDDGSVVDVSDIAFTTALTPIPFCIDFAGLYKGTEALEKLAGFVGVENGVAVLYVLFEGFNRRVAGILGLDESELESCPTGDSSTFLEEFAAQFNCLIPGTVGATFVCMENDDFSESLAGELQDSLKDEIESVVNDTINAVRTSNPIPDPEWFLDPDAIADNIKSDVTGSFLIQGVVNLGLIVAGFVTWNIAVIGVGLWRFISWVGGGPDDVIGNYSVAFDHDDLATFNPGSSETFSSDDVKDDVVYVDPIKSGGNDWALEGTIRVI